MSVVAEASYQMLEVFFILRSREGLIFLNNNNRSNCSGEKKKQWSFPEFIFEDMTKNFKLNLVFIAVLVREFWRSLVFIPGERGGWGGGGGIYAGYVPLAYQNP